MNIKKISIIALTLAALVGCSAADLKNYKTIGGGIGAATGAVAGNLISGGTRTGTLVGAAVGGVAGLGWGHYLDKQEAELRARLQDTGAVVERKGDELNIILPGGITFATNSDKIATSFNRPILEISSVLNKYPESRVLVEGHTDSTGSYDYNLALSKRRALSVKNFLINAGVDGSRISHLGYGPDEPVASNNTESGRQANRRVEIKIMQER